MKHVPVQEAVGLVLCQDITRIVPGEYKGPAFKKGHIITKDDIPHLLCLGKEHIYILSLEQGQIHENEAAIRMAKAAAGPGIAVSDVSEGRVNLIAERGVLRVNAEALQAINSIEEIAFATLHTNQYVAMARAVAGTRVVPLVVDESKIIEVERICAEHYPVIKVDPLRHHSVGVITTGSEIYHGRIKDAFGPIVREKYAALGSSVIGQRFVDDTQKMTVSAMHAFIDEGADMLVLTGGMSVDPDDQTPASIRAFGAEVVTYGAPVFPGVMFMLAYYNDVPILGLPGCVMYHRASIFELLVPRLLAGERLSRNDIVAFGHGGFCLGCAECSYPVCPFGKL